MENAKYLFYHISTPKKRRSAARPAAKIVDIPGYGTVEYGYILTPPATMTDQKEKTAARRSEEP